MISAGQTVAWGGASRRFRPTKLQINSRTRAKNQLFSPYSVV